MPLSRHTSSKGSKRTGIRLGLMTFLHCAFTVHPHYVVEPMSLTQLVLALPSLHQLLAQPPPAPLCVPPLVAVTVLTAHRLVQRVPERLRAAGRGLLPVPLPQAGPRAPACGLRAAGRAHGQTRWRRGETASRGLHNLERACPMGLWHNSVEIPIRARRV
jgi:hypothetical protein